MIADNIQVLTDRGWFKYNNLYNKQKIISYNNDIGSLEYDSIYNIKTTYVREALLGFNYKSMRQRVTSSHPLIIYNSITRELTRIPIKDLFFNNIYVDSSKKILYNRGFSIHKNNYDIEDVKWSARYCATYSQYKHFDEYPYEHINMVNNLDQYQAREWIDSFYHWMRKKPSRQWMFSAKLRNHVVRDMLFAAAPRAGVGAKWSKGTGITFYRYGKWSMNISSTADATADIEAPNWFRERYEGIVYNLETSNGNFVAKGSGGTFLIACEKRGE